MHLGWAEPTGQGWAQFADLGLAFLLSALIGLEREIRQKWAGLRTHTLVGVASALLVLVSKYGFSDVLEPGRIVLDPSRVAAQIVTGIGFLGAGLIFVRRDAVRGLTTAAVVWATAAVGMACGAGLPLIAIGVTGMYFITLFGFTPLTRRYFGSRVAPCELRLRYSDGQGALRQVLSTCTRLGFTVSEVTTEVDEQEPAAAPPPGKGNGTAPLATKPRRTVSATLNLFGNGSTAELGQQLSELDGVLTVHCGDGAEE